MQKNEKIQIRISEELLDYCKKNFQNVSLFIREAIREKIKSDTLVDPSKKFIEIRAKSTYTYHATLEKVIDGDTLLINFDVGFFISIKEKVRLIGINAPELATKKGKDAMAFIEKELKDTYLIVETRKKEKYGRFLCYVYYYKGSKNFEEIIRNGKLLNEELVKSGLADRYGE